MTSTIEIGDLVLREVAYMQMSALDDEFYVQKRYQSGRVVEVTEHAIGVRWGNRERTACDPRTLLKALPCGAEMLPEEFPN